MRTTPKLCEAVAAVVFVLGCSGTDDASPGISSMGGETTTSVGQPDDTGGASTAGGSTTAARSSSAVTDTAGGSLSTGGNLSAGGIASVGGRNATGGRGLTGGRPAAGGSVASGGAPTGGKVSTGGFFGVTGGRTSAGGAFVTGGRPPVGGRSATGGRSLTGGAASATGGTPGTLTSVTGGAPSNGGTSSGSSSVTVNCGGTPGSATCPEGVAAMCGMLDEHNKVRAAAPGANPAIPPLVWDCSLAATAQAWADTCPAGHSGTSGLGENIYWAGSTKLSTPAQVVAAWAGELSLYDYASNYCDGAPYTKDNFAPCGHYTQLVWRSTTRVGCGYANNCSSGMTQPWVCNYAPAGNVYNAKTGAMNLPY